MKPYFCLSGIKDLAQDLKGNENIYLGVRPYGFHAGNMSTLVAHPILLCKELLILGKIPRFNFYLFINDWEQEKLDGVDPQLYPFNILPKHTTWQFMPDPIDSNYSIVDFWEPIIKNNVQIITHYFPKTKINAVRNSSMKLFPLMKSCLLKTIKKPEIVSTALRQYTNRKILNNAIYASAVCPECKAARGITRVANHDRIIHVCTNCQVKCSGKYEDFEYWFYHKPLALPRIGTYCIDLCITGLDHYQEGDYQVRQKLLEEYKINVAPPKTLYTPVILGRNNLTMGKSKGNAEHYSLESIIKYIIENPTAEKLKILN